MTYRPVSSVAGPLSTHGKIAGHKYWAAYSQKNNLDEENTSESFSQFCQYYIWISRQVSRERSQSINWQPPPPAIYLSKKERQREITDL